MAGPDAASVSCTESAQCGPNAICWPLTSTCACDNGYTSQSTPPDGTNCYNYGGRRSIWVALLTRGSVPAQRAWGMHCAVDYGPAVQQHELDAGAVRRAV